MRMEPYTLREERYHDAVQAIMDEDGVDEDEAIAILEGRAEDAAEAAAEARAEAMADREYDRDVW